ncbi:protein asteroid homolog 1-like isoform X1 [Polypterus senegalus]|nr:protein asteroid homolog 1-like isoform X1 [Polypterus senegalus]
MGVQGLWGYADQRPEFFRDVKLMNTKIIIDGNNFYFKFYHNSCLDERHGGDYDLYAEALKRFFQTLSSCNIQPYVVLDGCCNHTDQKLETTKLRAEGHIKSAHDLSMGHKGRLLPLLSRNVFIQVLSKLGVPLVQCLLEADTEIAALANQWNCPVLSTDTDFFIFDLKGGFCPLTQFRWESASQGHIPARCYFIENFCAHFNGMNKDLLPLFAVIHGNDYSDMKMMYRFVRHVASSSHTSAYRGKKQAIIHSLLTWLSPLHNLKVAMENVLNVLPVSDRGVAQEYLSSQMQVYKIPERNLSGFFTSGASTTDDIQLRSLVLHWALGALEKAQLPKTVVDLLVLQRVFLIPQVENSERPNAHTCALPIRRAFYGMILNGRRHSSTSGPGGDGVEAAPCVVEEYGREKRNLTMSRVEATPPHSAKGVSLEQIEKLPLARRLQMFLEILGVSSSTVEEVPRHLIFPVYVTHFWLIHSDPRPSLQHLQAILVGIAEGSTASSGDALQELLTSPQKPLDQDAAHIFSQWQATLQISLYLNQLLCRPLEEPEVSGLYSGSLVHAVFRRLNLPTSPKALLSGSAFEIFGVLLRAVHTGIPDNYFSPRSTHPPLQQSLHK